MNYQWFTNQNHALQQSLNASKAFWLNKLHSPSTCHSCLATINHTDYFTITGPLETAVVITSTRARPFHKQNNDRATKWGPQVLHSYHGIQLFFRLMKFRTLALSAVNMGLFVFGAASVAVASECATVMSPDDPARGRNDISCKKVARNSNNGAIGFWRCCKENQQQN